MPAGLGAVGLLAVLRRMGLTGGYPLSVIRCPLSVVRAGREGRGLRCAHRDGFSGVAAWHGRGQRGAVSYGRRFHSRKVQARFHESRCSGVSFRSRAGVTRRLKLWPPGGST
jgi:hypothetical protein